MEWFSLAKNALKEAQNKIDKVLDIQDDTNEYIKDTNNDDDELNSSIQQQPQLQSDNIVNATTVVVKAPTLDNRNNINDLELFYTQTTTDCNNKDEKNFINNHNKLQTINSNDLKTVEVPSLDDHHDNKQIDAITTVTTNIDLPHADRVYDPDRPSWSSPCKLQAKDQHPGNRPASVAITNIDNETILDKSLLESVIYLNKNPDDDDDDLNSLKLMDNSILSDYVHITDDHGSGGTGTGGGGGSAADDEEKHYNEDTATSSSDIEIISNPNGGDSSSTNSLFRGSPIKNDDHHHQQNIKLNKIIPKKRHCRESSEISIQSEDETPQTVEIDKLMQRISELNEILENHEIHILDVNQQNVLLNKQLLQYQAQFQCKQMQHEMVNIEETTTQRLSILEKKYQTCIRERDALREQLNIITAKVPKINYEQIIIEKDAMIHELRTEGDKLSKQILQHSDIIKKLRTKERDHTILLKRNQEELGNSFNELDRLKKSLMAKDDLERTQIDAIHKLASNKRKLEMDNEMLQHQIDDLNMKLHTIQINDVAIKEELKNKQLINTELMKKTQLTGNLEVENHKLHNENQQIQLELNELQERLAMTDLENSMREQKLRQENSELLKRLECNELRTEKLNNDVSLATIPLIKQLEALQMTFNTRTKAWEKLEEEFLVKIKNYQENLNKLQNIEKQSSEQQQNLILNIKSLEDRLQSALLKTEEETSLLQQKEFTFNIEISEYKKKIFELEQKLEESLALINDYKEKQYEDFHNKHKYIINTEESTGNLSPQTITTTNDNVTATATEIIPTVNLHEQILTSNDNESPTLSLERHSIMSESLNSVGGGWQMDDLEVISNSGRRGGDPNLMYGGFNMSMMGVSQSAAIYENLQSTLKQKDGEINQIQWELSRMQTERNFLNSEITNLTLELVEIKEKLQSNTNLENELNELKKQYDALLQMYGEKVEETQELELDLQDVKDLYRGQIDELLKQQNQSATLANN